MKKNADPAAGERDVRRLLHELQAHQHELEAMKRELASSEERARQAIEASNAAIWDYDLASGRVYLSEVWSVLLGGEPKPTVTTIQALTELVPESERQTVRAAIIAAAKGRGSSQYRINHQVKKTDGGLLWICSEGKVVERGSDGQALRMIGTNRDITERMQFESELRMREARYRAVIETSADGFWMLDRQGRLIEANDAYVRLSGYSREELLDMHVADLEAKESAAEVAAHVDKVRREGHDRFESEHRRKDGSIWPVEIETTYWPAFDLVFVFVIDIGKRRKLEKELADRRKEMDALQKRQVAAQVAAAIARELNQPLTAIASYSTASLLMLNAEKPDLDGVRHALEESGKQALRAGEAIHDLLGLFNLGEVATETFDLNNEIAGVLALVRTEHELTFRTELELEAGLPRVRASRTHVHKVLHNLFYNSIEAMQEAGVPLPQITVAVRTEKNQNVALVTIRDNGPGLRQEDVGRLFEPFFTTKPSGIGMGLAIGRTLIEANGGQLWVDPQEGPGATFHLTLPFSG